MAGISLAGTTLVPQPTSVNENPVAIRTDQQAIDGSVQRDQMGEKKQAVLSWKYLTPAQYQTIIALIVSGNAVVYSNPNSNVSGGTLTFTGLPSYTQGDFVGGGSLMVPLKITVREV